MTYFLQANRNGGWDFYRAAGIKQHYVRLASAKMVAQDMGYRLVILNVKGEVLN